MEFLRAGQVAVGGQDERQKISELAETIPGVLDPAWRQVQVHEQLHGWRS
jgi:hypothetical protein